MTEGSPRGSFFQGPFSRYEHTGLPIEGQLGPRAFLMSSSEPNPLMHFGVALQPNARKASGRSIETPTPLLFQLPGTTRYITLQKDRALRLERCGNMFIGADG